MNRFAQLMLRGALPGLVACLASANLLTNPSFENSGPNFAPAANWDSSATADHATFSRPNNGALGSRFAFLNGDPADSRLWTLQVLSTDPTVPLSARATSDVAFDALTTYTFSGWAVDGTGDVGGEVLFEIGYLTNLADLNSFQPLSAMSYAVSDTWTSFAGASHTPGAGDAEVGQPIAVRIRAVDLTDGSDDIWFDQMSLIPEPASLMLLTLAGLALRRR